MENTLPGKKPEEIRRMFNRISHRYDLLNHLLSGGMDFFWRKRLVSLVKPFHPNAILDVATGTGDLAIALTRIKPQKIIGTDIAENMLSLAHIKIYRKKLQHIIELKYCHAEALPFPDETFDAATVAFGARNFGDIEKGLSEMLRVLKPGGGAWILEFSKPSKGIFSRIYRFYFKHVLPWLGGWISGENKAYRYLPESVDIFPEGAAMLALLEKVGYTDLSSLRLSGGMVTIYSGQKK